MKKLISYLLMALLMLGCIDKEVSKRIKAIDEQISAIDEQIKVNVKGYTTNGIKEDCPVSITGDVTNFCNICSEPLNLPVSQDSINFGVPFLSWRNWVHFKSTSKGKLNAIALVNLYVDHEGLGFDLHKIYAKGFNDKAFSLQMELEDVSDNRVLVGTTIEDAVTIGEKWDFPILEKFVFKSDATFSRVPYIAGDASIEDYLPEDLDLNDNDSSMNYLQKIENRLINLIYIKNDNNLIPDRTYKLRLILTDKSSNQKITLTAPNIENFSKELVKLDISEPEEIMEFLGIEKDKRKFKKRYKTCELYQQKNMLMFDRLHLLSGEKVINN